MRDLTDIIWKRLDAPGLELMSLEVQQYAVHLEGTIITVEQGAPLRIHYVVVCNSGWVTVGVHLAQYWEGTTSRLSLQHDGRGHWRRDGVPAPELEGCLDVDISLSPSTNSLPIRRLSLAQGDEQEVTAAWILFPSMTTKISHQRYQRTGVSDYRFCLIDGDFEGAIKIDRDGLVASYAGLWTRISRRELVAGMD